ncbi:MULTISPECIES: response regulator transcription factor [unclassified Oceanispirochaeta]|uniref:response regulator transcription factor n=1 Tax=unclassified Oceanispirochaeta TaxID=2635722 RepID=UPI000E0969CB|nr:MULTISPECIES: response regulator transcription factor [unclassified Oceanispirochaeta]MBF9018626.1 response regulator transcription factor [Oceanispirochaeta sp. M2]NPD75063.1 response regulator transcription factor [Oceanispirochaeta sp. M1]RDG29089.1 DNA-binding response regulator [Oceanispirochaeta sp. M1]
MNNKTILVSSRDAFTGSLLVDIVEKEHIGKICSYCSDGPTTLQNIERFRPHFILLDLFLPGMNGISILKEIKELLTNPQILCYCRKMNKMLGVKAAKYGATALIDYTSNREEFRSRIERTSRGIKSYPCDIQELLDENDYEIYPQKYTEITTRQTQIIEQLSLGKSNMEIASTLGITVKTVEWHKNIVREKFGLASMAEIVHFAIRNGIIEREEGICM